MRNFSQIKRNSITILQRNSKSFVNIWSAEYNKVNVKLSDSQLNKLRSSAKNQTGVTLRINIKMFDGNNLPYKLLLTARQKTKPRNAFENILSAGIKLSKTQISKITNFGGFLGSLLRKIAGPLMKVAVPVAKNNLAPLGITTAASAVDAGFQKKIHGCGTTTLIISNEEMNDIMKIVQALKDYNILVTGIIRKEYKSIIRINRDLMEFILKIICLKK